MTSDEPGPSTDPAGHSLAARLDRLFKLTADTDGHEDSYRVVAAAIEAAGGPTVSSSYLHQLRTGQKDNPTKRHLDALAAYFGVPPAYFFDEALAAEVNAQLRMLRALRDAGVMHVAIRARGLSPDSLEMFSRMLDQVRRLEGLDMTEREIDARNRTILSSEADGPPDESDGQPLA